MVTILWDRTLLGEGMLIIDPVKQYYLSQTKPEHVSFRTGGNIVLSQPTFGVKS